MVDSRPVVPVVYTFKVNGQQINEGPVDVDLSQRWGKHDIMQVRILVPKHHGSRKKLVPWPDLSTVEVAYGRGGGNQETWYGYVNHHTFATNDDQDIGTLQVIYTLIGTSHVMDCDTSRNWVDVTYSNIAVRMAKNYRMRCVVTTTTDVVHEIQVSESDFTFMNRMADKIGFQFWVSGGTMYFIDPLVMLAPQSRYFVPHFSIDKLDTQFDTARNLDIHDGHNIPGSQVATRSISGYDRSTGLPFTVQADGNTMPIFDLSFSNSHRHVTSVQEGRRVINATQSLSQFWTHGTVEVFGKTFLYPGKSIYLEGEGVPYDKAGHWLVLGARHVLHAMYTSLPQDDWYGTQLEVARNASGVTYYKGVQHVNPERVPCRVVGQMWQSTRTGVVQQGLSQA